MNSARKASWEPVNLKMDQDSSDEGTYEVESIEGVRKRGSTIQYLVKWRGYGPEDNTWEPARNLIGAKEAIEEYLRRSDEGKKSVTKEKKVSTFTKIQTSAMSGFKTWSSQASTSFSRCLTDLNTGRQKRTQSVLGRGSRSLKSCVCVSCLAEMNVCHHVVLLCFLFIFTTFLISL